MLVGHSLGGAIALAVALDHPHTVSRLALIAPLTGAHVVGLSAGDLLIDRPAAELLHAFAPSVPLRAPVGPRGPLVDAARARELLRFEPTFSIHRPDPAADPLALGALHA